MKEEAALKKMKEDLKNSAREAVIREVQKSMAEDDNNEANVNREKK